jgi:hypothetical protein
MYPNLRTPGHQPYNHHYQVEFPSNKYPRLEDDYKAAEVLHHLLSRSREPNRQLGMGLQEEATVEESADQSPSGRGISWVIPHRYPRLKDNSNCPGWTGHTWTHREQGVVAMIQRLLAEEQMQVKELLEQLEQGYPRMSTALELGHSQQARLKCRLRTVS